MHTSIYCTVLLPVPLLDYVNLINVHVVANCHTRTYVSRSILTSTAIKILCLKNHFLDLKRLPVD